MVLQGSASIPIRNATVHGATGAGRDADIEIIYGFKDLGQPEGADRNCV